MHTVFPVSEFVGYCCSERVQFSAVYRRQPDSNLTDNGLDPFRLGLLDQGIKDDLIARSHNIILANAMYSILVLKDARCALTKAIRRNS